MIKYLFILINSVTLFILSLFTGDGVVVVSSSIPETMKTGEEVMVELKINKEGISGFAKYQMELPGGFSLKPVDNLGSEFSSEGQVVKWVWPSLPEESEMTIKFKLVADESAMGLRAINSSFHYIEYNEKKAIDVPPITVNVIQGEAPAKKAPEPVAIVDTIQQKNPAPESHAEPLGNIEVIRRISHPANTSGEYTLTIKIKKGNTKGFARYSDDITEGLTAKALKVDGGSFSVADGKLKFVWVNVPEKDELEIAYTLQGPSITKYSATGEYSYLENNQSKKVKLESEAIVAPEPAKEEVVVKEPDKKEPENEVTEEKTEKKKKEEEEPVASNKPKKKRWFGKGPEKKEGSANFHIQIGAFTNSKVTAETLRKKFRVEDEINSEMQEGFSKFMIGDYIDYKKARDKREDVKSTNGVKSAFVVAYNDGKRITVQEALMISNQKWFK